MSFSIDKVTNTPQAPAFVFNPPTASEIEMAEPIPTRLPYELRRVTAPTLGIRTRREARRAVVNGRERNVYDGPEHYYRPCRRANATRNACTNEIEVYRVVTGQYATGDAGEGVAEYKATHVYYWPDTAIVVETATGYSRRPVQAGFCSWKCLSLWAAKLARDTES